MGLLKRSKLIHIKYDINGSTPKCVPLRPLCVLFLLLLLSVFLNPLTFSTARVNEERLTHTSCTLWKWLGRGNEGSATPCCSLISNFPVTSRQPLPRCMHNIHLLVFVYMGSGRNLEFQPGVGNLWLSNNSSTFSIQFKLKCSSYFVVVVSFILTWSLEIGLMHVCSQKCSTGVAWATGALS